MTKNNFFTHIKKWGTLSKKLGNPPFFFRQSFSFENKEFVPFDEFKSRTKEISIEKLIPHFFIDDEKQTCFSDDPKKHSELLDKVPAILSTDYSVFTNVYPEFNATIILLNRLIASYWQQLGRFVIITLTWANEDTFDIAFNNIERGTIVGISTEGVSDFDCFKKGFLEMLKRISPSKICWYDTIPEWVYDYYKKENIVIIPKRFKQVEKKLRNKEFQYSLNFEGN